MPEHDDFNVAELDSRGERLWRFSLRYELPNEPADGRDYFNALSVADEAVHDITGKAEAWGSAWPKKQTVLFLMRSFGRYSYAHEQIVTRVSDALSQGSLAASKLIELSFTDPDAPIDDTEPPF